MHFKYLRIAAACLCIGLFISPSAFSQARQNPTQQNVAAPDEQVPLFRVTVVGRTVPAVNYRPRTGETRLDFAGTALMPEAEGRAEISGRGGYFRIQVQFDDLEPPSRFGPEYLTYVLWAITPEGRASNLGEVQLTGNDRRLTVTTELQTFALIVTAEPYFAVTQPSDVVVLENIVREDGLAPTRGRVETVAAQYELLKRGSYLMNQDAAVLKVTPLEPGAPLDVAQARNAVQLARIAGADRFAAETFSRAADLLAEAELAREQRRGRNAVMQPAREAVQTAEDARLIALQRQEEAFQAEQRRLAQQREAEARERAQLEEERRRAADQQRLQAEAQRLQAEREKMAADAARLAAERDRAEAERARVEAERIRAEAERMKAEAEAARAAAEAQAREIAGQAERDQAALREELRQQLNLILETRETARGLIVNVSDVLFDVDSATLKPGARERLARVAGILSAHPDLQLAIEGHTDSTGAEEYNERLSERRAEAVRSYLTEQGVARETVSTAGYGESRPVATNGTAQGRQMNRRVEIVVSGEAIGVTGR